MAKTWNCVFEFLWEPFRGLKKVEEPHNICDTRSFLFQDDQEPKDPKFSPDGGYIPRVLFMGKSVAFGSQLKKK